MTDRATIRSPSCAKSSREIRGRGWFGCSETVGQTHAIATGFFYARGRTIVCMDGDLQNDPEDIPRLLERMEAGFDLVSGWRGTTNKLVTRKIPSRVANWLIGRILGVRLHDYGCSLKAYNARIMKSLKLYSDMHRFLPALASRCGARVTELPVNHRPRTLGKSRVRLVAGVQKSRSTSS